MAFHRKYIQKKPKKPKESVHLLPTAYSNEKITTGKQPKHKRLSNEEVFDLETQATLCFFSIFSVIEQTPNFCIVLTCLSVTLVKSSGELICPFTNKQQDLL